MDAHLTATREGKSPRRWEKGGLRALRKRLRKENETATKGARLGEKRELK